MITHKEFAKKLIEAFPEMESELNDDDFKGILTLEVGVFLRFTQAVINAGDIKTLKKCFSFIEDNLPNFDTKIENSIYISYLQKLDFSNHADYINFLSPELKSAIVQMEAYHKNAESNKKLTDFLNKGAK